MNLYQQKPKPVKKFNSLMIIDDEEDCRFLLKCFNDREKIAKNFYEFFTVDDALTYIQNNADKDFGEKGNIILLDLFMPGKNGYDFLEVFTKMYNNEQKFKVFILTGSDKIEDKVKTSKYDVDGYLVKPFTHKKLMMMLSLQTMQ